MDEGDGAIEGEGTRNDVKSSKESLDWSGELSGNFDVFYIVG